jgi:hypothetical protein
MFELDPQELDLLRRLKAEALLEGFRITSTRDMHGPRYGIRQHGRELYRTRDLAAIADWLEA